MRYKFGVSNKLAKRRRGGGIVPAVGSAIIPGLGQLMNGETDKAIGVFAIATIAGLGFWGGLPLIGAAAGIVALGTWIYGIGDGYAGKS